MEIPANCEKCTGLVLWDGGDTFRCCCCGKRYYQFNLLHQFRRAFFTLTSLATTRTPRNREEHAAYMRIYMRQYREKRRRMRED